MTCGCACCDQQPLTVDEFRTLFPVFTSPPYSDEMVKAWLDLAPVDPCIWCDRYHLGQALWAAHELTKYGPNGLAGAAGSGVSGAIQSKAVGPVSVSYDVRLGFVEGAGPYNLTIYGQQFYFFAQMIGLGSIPMQIGAATPSPSGAGRGAWPGPWPFPGAAGFSS